jgi:hypothetical protein
LRFLTDLDLVKNPKNRKFLKISTSYGTIFFRFLDFWPILIWSKIVHLKSWDFWPNFSVKNRHKNEISIFDQKSDFWPKVRSNHIFDWFPIINGVLCWFLINSLISFSSFFKQHTNVSEVSTTIPVSWWTTSTNIPIYTEFDDLALIVACLSANCHLLYCYLLLLMIIFERNIKKYYF